MTAKARRPKKSATVTSIEIAPQEPIPTAPAELAAVCAELVYLRKDHRQTIRSRIMSTNYLQAVVACSNGYQSSGKVQKADGSEEDIDSPLRRQYFKQAAEQIKSVWEKHLIREQEARARQDLVVGYGDETHARKELIIAQMSGIHALNQLQARTEEKMVAQMRSPALRKIVEWLEQPEQNGAGLPMVAQLIGEIGDLTCYANPGKVWKRMSCVPYVFEDRSAMASTWKRGRDGIKLPAEEWAKYGYSPRRRAMAYVLADCLIKGNIVGAQRVDGKRVGGKPGPYRLRYQEEKRRVFHKYPTWNWTDCTTCDGAGVDAEREMCSTCSGTGKKSMHAHLHSSLLCSKLFLRELWNVWHGKSHAVHGWKG